MTPCRKIGVVGAIEQVREFWDEDAATYDHDLRHHPVAPAVLAALRASLAGLLPPPPCTVLDVGAGTGFLSLIAAEVGHRVTALDLSPQMLEVLRGKAERVGLHLDLVEAEAQAVPHGPFDAVISRHLLWTLLDPVTALRSWREAAPNGRLVLVENLWGDASSPIDRLRHLALSALAQARGTPHAHHGSYDPELAAALPLGAGTGPETLLRLVARSGWPNPRLHRLSTVDWAAQRSLPWPERALGVAPNFAVVAGA